MVFLKKNYRGAISPGFSSANLNQHVSVQNGSEKLLLRKYFLHCLHFIVYEFFSLIKGYEYIIPDINLSNWLFPPLIRHG